MTTIKEEFENFTAKCGDVGDKIIGYAILHSTLNMLREGAEELDNEEVLDALDSLQTILENKTNELFKGEIE